MSDQRFKGMGVALVTPFRADRSVDFDAIGRLVDFQIAGGADYIVLLATTGESVTLSPREREKVRQYVIERVGGRVPIVLGFGGNDTLWLASQLSQMDLSSFAAILSVVPFYSKPTQEGIYQHFMTVADASPVPVILYNVPGRTGVNMTADTTLRLAFDSPNIAGIKEASGNVEQCVEILRHAPGRFSLISGDDALTLQLVAQGAAGVISVIGNALPGTFSQMVHLAMSGHTEAAREIDQRLAPLYHLLFVDGNPAGVKALLHQMGLAENMLRLPLVPATEATCRELSKFMSLASAEFAHC